MFQSTRPFAGRAIATARAGDAYLRASEAHLKYGAILLGNAGNLLTKRGEHERAFASLDAALALAAKDYAALGDDARAARYREAAMRLEPRHPALRG